MARYMTINLCGLRKVGALTNLRFHLKTDLNYSSIVPLFAAATFKS